MGQSWTACKSGTPSPTSSKQSTSHRNYRNAADPAFDRKLCIGFSIGRSIDYLPVGLLTVAIANGLPKAATLAQWRWPIRRAGWKAVGMFRGVLECTDRYIKTIPSQLCFSVQIHCLTVDTSWDPWILFPGVQSCWSFSLFQHLSVWYRIWSWSNISGRPGQPNFGQPLFIDVHEVLSPSTHIKPLISAKHTQQTDDLIYTVIWCDLYIFVWICMPVPSRSIQCHDVLMRRTGVWLAVAAVLAGWSSCLVSFEAFEERFLAWQNAARSRSRRPSRPRYLGSTEAASVRSATCKAMLRKWPGRTVKEFCSVVGGLSALDLLHALRKQQRLGCK